MGAVRARSLLLVTKALGYVAVPICAPCHRYELLSSVVIYLCCPSPVLSCWLEFFRICHFLNLLFPNCKGAPWTWQETLRGGGGHCRIFRNFMGNWRSARRTLLELLVQGSPQFQQLRRLPSVSLWTWVLAFVLVKNQYLNNLTEQEMRKSLSSPNPTFVN